jgi:hypothetical protein
MRYVARALLLAAVLLVAGCSLFRDPRLHVAEITSIAAPDTVHAGTAFDVTFHVVIGYEACFALDHEDISSTSSCFALRVWSRDVRREGYLIPQVTVEKDLAFEAGPAEPGEFRVIAHQPDGSTTQKTITVLP